MCDCNNCQNVYCELQIRVDALENAVLPPDSDNQTLSINTSDELCISGGNCIPLPTPQTVSQCIKYEGHDCEIMKISQENCPGITLPLAKYVHECEMSNESAYRGNFFVPGDGLEATGVVLSETITNTYDCPMTITANVINPQLQHNEGDGRVEAFWYYQSFINGVASTPVRRFHFYRHDTRGNTTAARELNAKSGQFADIRISGGQYCFQLAPGDTYRVDMTGRLRHYIETTEPTIMQLWHGQISVNLTGITY